MIPVWVQRMPAIWLASIQGLDPRMPTGALLLQPEEAAALAGGAPVSLALAKAWLTGAQVLHADDAPAQVHDLAERLRSILPEACRAYAASVGTDFGLPRTGQVVATNASAESPEALADAVSDEHPDGVYRLSAEARVLLALRGL